MYSLKELNRLKTLLYKRKKRFILFYFYKKKKKSIENFVLKCSLDVNPLTNFVDKFPQTELP